MNWNIFSQDGVFDIGSPTPSASPMTASKMKNIFGFSMNSRVISTLYQTLGVSQYGTFSLVCKDWYVISKSIVEIERWMMEKSSKKLIIKLTGNFFEVPHVITNLPITKVEMKHPNVEYTFIDKYRITMNRYLGKKIYMKENRKLLNYGKIDKFLILICQGGAFAGLYAEKNKIIVHKAFSRYVVRKKQGKRQINKDKGKGGIHSAGSEMRRNNEIVFKNLVEKTMGEWKKHWGTKKEDLLILLHAPGHYNKSLVIGKNEYLIKENDDRVCTIPYTIYNVNFTQVKSILTTILSIKIEE